MVGFLGIVAVIYAAINVVHSLVSLIKECVLLGSAMKKRDK